MDTMIDDYDDHVESVTIKTESCHPQAAGHHGDYIDYVKQLEDSSHDPPSLPVVKVQPIRIEGFGSDDLNVQCNKDEVISLQCYCNVTVILFPQQSYLTIQFIRLLSLLYVTMVMITDIIILIV